MDNDGFSPAHSALYKNNIDVFKVLMPRMSPELLQDPKIRDHGIAIEFVVVVDVE